MSKRQDYLSALRTDIVRVLREDGDMSEAEAVSVAARIIKSMRLRYQGKDIRFGRERVSAEEIRTRFNGRNHSQVCRDLGISMRTLYRALTPPRPLSSPQKLGETDHDARPCNSEQPAAEPDACGLSGAAAAAQTTSAPTTFACESRGSREGR